MSSGGWYFLFNTVWLESPPLCCVLRPPQHCQPACECVQTSPGAEDQGTYVRTGGQGLLACQVQVACPVISACLLNGPSTTDHFTCSMVNRPVWINQSTYGGRLSNAQWNLLLQMCIMWKLDSICIQSNSRLLVDSPIYFPCTCGC